jgi:alpha-N-arabinofuranosidase
MDTPLLDISAALSDDGFVNLAVVNVSAERAFGTSLPMVEAPVMLFTVGERRMGSAM